MHKLVGPVPRDERWSPQRPSLPLSNELTTPVRRTVDRMVTRLSGDVLWVRMWWETGGRAMVASLVLGPPTPALARTGATRRPGR